MKNKTVIITIIALAVVFGLGIYLWYGTSQAAIIDITAQKPNLLIHGKNLSRVEVWAIPTGTGITESDYEPLGDAKLTDTVSGVQTWTLGIPANPILATGIFAKGYDMAGSAVGTLNLSQTGATDIFNALWGNVAASSTATSTTSHSTSTVTGASGTITLGVGQSGTVSGLTITFNKLVQDSRCPVDVRCIEAGAVNTNVTFKAGAQSTTRNMASDEVPLTFGGYAISITSVQPDRKSGHEIPGADYRVSFHVGPHLTSPITPAVPVTPVNPNPPAPVIPPAGAITISGTVLCLPPQNPDAPHTLECAFGLRDTQGQYYALRDADPNYQNVSGIPFNSIVIIKGTFTPGTSTSYSIVGTIIVSSIIR